MHPYILRLLAAERSRDMRHQATAARASRLARRGRHQRPAGVACAGTVSPIARGVVQS
jgi:hypothetical protein